MAVAGVQVANPDNQNSIFTGKDNFQPKSGSVPENPESSAFSADSAVHSVHSALDFDKPNQLQDEQEKTVIVCQSHIRGYLTRLKYRKQGKESLFISSQL